MKCDEASYYINLSCCQFSKFLVYLSIIIICRAMAKSFQPAKLDVDPSILDSNLMMVQGEDDPLSSLFPSQPKKNPLSSLLPEDEFESVTVVPKPGLCVKAKNKDGTKFFINICKLAEIPSPPPIEESELAKVISEEDYTNLWRVPMSLGAPRTERDKSGAECLAAEVAINSQWFDKTMVDSDLFTGFVVTIAMEGLCDKYGDQANLDRNNWTILKNKKFLGDNCPAHTIQKRQNVGIQHIEESSGITEVMSTQLNSNKKAMIQELSPAAENTCSEIEPNFEIRKEPNTDPVQLKCRVNLPGVNSVKDITLDLGEDRIVLNCSKTRHHLDIFLPYNMNVDKSSATFIRDEHVLSLTLPIVV